MLNSKAINLLTEAQAHRCKCQALTTRKAASAPTTTTTTTRTATMQTKRGKKEKPEPKNKQHQNEIANLLERECHASADHHHVHFVEQILNEFDLIAHFGAPQNRKERSLRGLQCLFAAYETTT
jgi:hypothetical protein